MTAKVITILSILLTLTAFASAQQPLQIQFFTESLCPSCIKFITTSIAQAIKAPNFLDMANITIYPYGNAYETFNSTSALWTFKCQHGETEFYGNILEVCSQSIYTGLDFWNWLVCVEANVGSTSNFDITGASCALNYGLDFTPVKTCTESQEANALQHSISTTTESLNPSHYYVPWITLDFNHLANVESEILSSLLDYVCKNYNGTKSPSCPQ